MYNIDNPPMCLECQFVGPMEITLKFNKGLCSTDCCDAFIAGNDVNELLDDLGIVKK